jgi:hypothetical protein
VEERAALVRNADHGHRNGRALAAFIKDAGIAKIIGETVVAFNVPGILSRSSSPR